MFRSLLACSCILLAALATVCDAGDLRGKRVRDIRITGLKHTREDVVRQQLYSEAGQAFQEVNLLRDRERLDRLGVFSAIRVTATEVEDEVGIQVEVRETFRFFPYPSLNISAENGVSAGVGVKALNLRGEGISSSVSARFGAATEVEALLKSPWWAKRRLWYDLTYYYRDRLNKLDNFQENTHEAEIRLGSHLGDSHRIGARFDFLRLKASEPSRTLSTESTGDHDSNRGLGAVFENDTRDLWSNPHRGWWNSWDLTHYGGLFGGDAEYWRANLDVRRYQPLAERHTLAVFSLATLQSGTVGVDVPIYSDFHLGGTNTIRGWGLDARRGKNQFINTVEYRYEILKPRPVSVRGLNFYVGLHLAAFGDFGTAWDEGGQFSKNFIGGGGLGLRVVFPFIDLVRIDFGFGQSGKGITPHIGLREKAYYQRLRVR